MKVSTGARLASMRLASMQRQISELHIQLENSRICGERMAAERQSIMYALKDLSDALHGHGKELPDVIATLDKIRTGVFSVFTQQHYIAVAAIIKAEREKLSDDYPESAHKHEQINQLQLAFIKKFEADNPKFNKLLFIGACGETGG